MQNEQQIMLWLKTANPKGMESLYDHYSAALYGIALKIVPDPQIAQDVLQEAFVKIWKSAGSYDASKGTLFTWCLNILRNTAIDKTRSLGYRKSGKIQPLEHFVDIGKQSIQPDQIGMKDFVFNLEDKYREVIDLIYFQGYTQREVEETLNIPLGTVKSRLRIGLSKLRTIFDANCVTLGVIFFMLG